jgi:phosphoribosylformylglycinamidine synthase
MAIQGMSAACKQFDTPVTGGNVSFYNQKKNGDAVYPTPAIGMLGLVDNPSRITSLAFRQKDHVIYMLGKNVEDIACSEYLVRWHGFTESHVPYFDLQEEFAMQKSLQELIDGNIVMSAHDVSEGGLLTALMEAGFPNQLGFEIETDASIRKDAFLFGEAQGRAVVSIDEQQQDELETRLESDGVPFLRLGKVTEGEVNIDGESFGSIEQWSKKYEQALEEMLKEE